MEALTALAAGSGPQMIERFLRARGIVDADVLAAMARIPRHRFVPDSFRAHAYSDTPLPIGHEQTISQPYIVGLMTQELLKVTRGRVLEIGTGSGYQTAVLAALVKSVFSIERVLGFIAKARAVIEEQGHHNVSIRVGNGAHGWPEHAPFDAVLATACVRGIPKAWIDQTTPQAVIIAPVGEPDGEQNLHVYKKVGKTLQKRVLGPCRFVPFIDA